MDQRLVLGFAENLIRTAQSRRGITDLSLADRLGGLGAPVSVADVSAQLTDHGMSAVFLLTCMIALEIDAIERSDLVDFVRTLSCPWCAPFQELPTLSPPSLLDNGPIPF